MTTFTRRALLAGAALDAIAVHPALARQEERDGIVRPTALGPTIPPELFARSGNWPVAQGDLAATRSATGSTIDSTNAANLEVIWEFPVEASTGYGGMTATPIVIGETVYLQDMHSNVFALDRANGKLRWSHEVDIPCIGPNGVAVAYGRLFGAAGDTKEVFSLDATTGETLWRVQLSNNPGEGIDMAPAVYDSTVYVSTVAGNTQSFNSGGTKGILYALDASTGATLWQFDTTTDNLWGNPRINSGGGLWYPPSFDDDGGIYFGTGNAAPWPGNEALPNASSRPEPNDYASSIVALDCATGSFRWHYNAAPHDLLDHDFQNTPLLVEAEIDGVSRKLAIGSGKTGTVVAADRADGSIVWTTAVGEHRGDAVTRLTEKPVEIFPGAWGGVLTPPAYADGRVFVPIVNQPTVYTATGVDKMSMFDFNNASGAIIAVDSATGTLVWQQQLASPAVGAATVVNDVVITAGFDGGIRLFSAESGALIGRHWAQAGVNAPPAVAGGILIVAAAGPRIASSDSPTDADRSPSPAVIALGSRAAP